jgi:D-aspartate ligase
MKKYTNPAVVMGAGITGLGVVRNLGRNDIDVYCLFQKGRARDAVAIYSKYARKCYVLSRPHEEKVKDYLIKLKDQYGVPPVVFPTSDVTALEVADLKSQVEFLTPTGERRVIETLIEKREFYKSLASAGVPHPATYFPENVEDIETASKEMSYPVFLKPSMSQLFSGQFGKKGFVAYSEKELREYLALAEKHRIYVMIQEIVPGPPISHYFIDGFFDRNSNPKALLARRRLRMWPLQFGNSSTCVSVPMKMVESFKDTLIHYLRSINYRGIFSAEFKKDERDNVFKLLEVNARCWWFNSFPAKCGIDIIFKAYLDCIGEKVEYSEEYMAGVKLTYLYTDMRSILSTLARNKPIPRDGVIRGRDWVFFSRDDLRPFLMSLVYAPMGGC